MEHLLAPGFPVLRWLHASLRRPRTALRPLPRVTPASTTDDRRRYPLWMWRCAAVLPNPSLRRS